MIAERVTTTRKTGTHYPLDYGNALPREALNHSDFNDMRRDAALTVMANGGYAIYEARCFPRSTGIVEKAYGPGTQSLTIDRCHEVIRPRRLAKLDRGAEPKFLVLVVVQEVPAPRTLAPLQPPPIWPLLSPPSPSLLSATFSPSSPTSENAVVSRGVKRIGTPAIHVFGYMRSHLYCG